MTGSSLPTKVGAPTRPHFLVFAQAVDPGTATKLGHDVTGWGAGRAISDAEAAAPEKN